MSKVVACIIARTVSTRLPLKVLRDLDTGISMLDFLIKRLKSVNSIDEIYICTSFEKVDDILDDVAVRNDVKIYRGGTEDVIERMMSVSKIESADIIIRITGDNPLTSIEFIDNQIDFLIKENLDYVRIIDVPIGSTAEVIKRTALEHCYENMDKSVSEYLMLFLFEPEKYRCGILKVTNTDYSEYTLTIDTEEDLIRTKQLLKELNYSKPEKILLKDILKIYDKHTMLNTKILSIGEVKLPYGKVESFANFQKDMIRRKENSLKFIINE